jgi:hypothetical protein
MSELAGTRPQSQVWLMFMVSEADAATIRAAFERDGELSASAEFRRLYPAVADRAEVRAWARTIAGWRPIPPPVKARRAGRGQAD